MNGALSLPGNANSSFPRGFCIAVWEAGLRHKVIRGLVAVMRQPYRNGAAKGAKKGKRKWEEKGKGEERRTGGKGKEELCRAVSENYFGL